MQLRSSFRCSGLRLLLAVALPFPATALAGWTNVAGTTSSEIRGNKDGGAVFADVNGDGFLDILVNTSDATRASRLLLSDGSMPNPKFVDATSSQAPGLEGSTRERSALVADWNNDGNPDLLRNNSPYIDLYLGTGPTAYTFGNPASGGPTLTIDATFKSLGYADFDGVATADINRDGWLDLIASNDSKGVQIFMNTGTAGLDFSVTQMSSTGLPTNANWMDYVTLVDYDVDGWPDLGARIDGAYDIWHSNGNGTFTAATSFDYAAEEAVKGGITFCDFDKDGDLDFIWTDGGWDNQTSGNTNEIWRNDGNNVFTPTGKPNLSGYRVNDAVCGDIDNDGDLDLFLATDTADLLFRNTSTAGNIQLTQDTTLPAESVRSTSAAMGDYDHDGDLDIYVNRDGGNALWRNDLDDQDYLIVDMSNVVSNCPGTRVERADILASARLYNTGYSPLSGMHQVDGGHGRGSQAPPLLHFGLPNGPNTRYYLEVRFTGLAKPDGYIEVVPSQLGTYHLLKVRDTDPDGDGLRSLAEQQDSTVSDVDGDGFDNWFDADSDDDGLLDSEEAGNVPWCATSRPDTDGDGKPDYLDTDSDDDGLTDEEEVFTYGTSPIGSDSDGDSLSDGDEVHIWGSDPLLVDTDSDGLTDLEETWVGTNPSNADSDGDTVGDLTEVGNVFAPLNTDNDQYIDALDSDDDNDGIPTASEDVNGNGTPTDDFSDGDAWPDYLDNNDDNDDYLTWDEGGSDGTWATRDGDRDGTPDYRDPDDVDPNADSDGDNVPDYREVELGLDPDNPDTDGDGLTDGTEIGDLDNPRDTDGDHLIDAADPDDDGDGLDTRDEGFTDKDGDSIPNYLDLDSDGDGAYDATEGLEDSDGDGVVDFLDNGAEGASAHGQPPSGPDHRGFGCATPVGAHPPLWLLLGLPLVSLRRRTGR